MEKVRPELATVGPCWDRLRWWKITPNVVEGLKMWVGFTRGRTNGAPIYKRGLLGVKPPRGTLGDIKRGPGGPLRTQRMLDEDNTEADR